ncbi:transcriptional regulator [Actinosynnema pretiosum]|uniref:Transcriptional regulator n=2 Tax=Actinosynnema pretiosum TaxID=42197 RepID=A0A290Z653_9PSEU|nr:transcriptional regulator [Actinosynnema pretiosum]
MLTDALRGSGGVALVRGPSGSGKTALLNAFAEHASALGVRWLGATAWGARADRAAGLADQLARAGGSAPAPPDHREDHVPLVVAVDDFQHADVGFADELLHLARELRFRPALLVLAELTPLRPHQHPARSQLLRHPRFSSIRLGPLSRDGGATLIAGSVPDQVPRPLLDAAHAATGGNPALVSAIAEDLGAGLREPPWGESFGHTVRAFLDAAEPPVREAATALAVLGPSAPPRALAALLRVDPTTADARLGALVEAGLVQARRFRHPAVGAAVLAGTDQQTRSDLDHRAALVLRDLGAPVTAVARHLLDAGALPGPATRWEAAVLSEAAEHAIASDELDLARRHLELARQRCPDEHGRAELAARLAVVDWRLGTTGVTGKLPELLEAADRGFLRDDDALEVTGQLLWHGRIAEAARLLGRVGGDVSPAGLRAAHLWVALSCPALLAHMPSPAPRGLDPAATMTTDTDARLRAVEALDALLRGGPDTAPVNEAVRVLQVGAASKSSLEPSGFALLVLLYADRFEEARSWCELLIELARDRGVPAWQATFAEIRAQIAARTGDLPSAVRHAHAALASTSARGWGAAVGVPLGVLVEALVDMGRFAEAEEALNRPVPPTMFQTRWGLHHLHARGRYHLATGRPHAALGDFLAVGERLRLWDLDLPALIPWRTGAAEAHLGLGDRAAAARLLAEQSALPGGGGPRLRGTALRVGAAAAEPGLRVRLAKEAVDQLEIAGDRLELARAFVELCAAFRACGDPRRARTVARRALLVAEGCRAEPLVEALAGHSGAGHPEPRQDPAPGVEDVCSLTGAERRVAELAAVGATNREIARTLVVTVSTVEQHLTKVYRKLSVRRRTELPAALAIHVGRGDDPWRTGAGPRYADHGPRRLA